MPTPRFNLKNKTQDPALILLVFRVRGFRFVYSTGQKVPLRHWDTRRGRAKFQYTPAVFINDILSKMEDACQVFYSRSVAAGTGFDFDQLREELDQITHRIPVKQSEAPNLVHFIQAAIKQRKQSGKYKANTFKAYDMLLAHLQAFVLEYRVRLNFSDIDLEFFYAFSEFLFRKRSLATNTASKVVQTLRLFLAEAEDKGIPVNPIYKSSRFKITSVETVQVYLSDAELAKIEAVELPPGNRLDRVRDLFLLACWTGARYSDLPQIKRTNLRTVSGVLMLTFSQSKTDNPVTIPINPKAKAILEKYDYHPPVQISNQKYNDYLKELCQMAKLNTPVMWYNFAGGKRKEVVSQKWELITSHTARRTFATNAFKAGVPTLTIGKITGHKTEKTLLQYIRVTGEENALLASKNPFFGGDDGE